MATNQLVGPMLTDFYQISMAYAYWIGGRAEDNAGQFLNYITYLNTSCPLCAIPLLLSLSSNTLQWLYHEFGHKVTSCR